MDAFDPSDARTLMELIAGKWISYAIHAVARLRIPDLLDDGPKVVEDLAAATGTRPELLYRLLRALASVGLFTEAAGRRFALTRMGALLRSGPMSLRGMAIMNHLEMDDRAWQHLPRTLVSGAPAFEEAHGMRAFEWLAEHPDDAATFDEAMAGYAALHHVAVARDYDFSGIRTLVDVGGGDATILCAILRAAPSLKAILLDLPHTVERARRRIIEAGLDGRCDVVPGDFFQSVPAGDAYFIAHILHNWSDDDCVTILRNCRRAMTPGGRVLAVEMLVPPEDRPHFVKVLDIAMLVWNRGGRERTEAEYRALFARAGLELGRVVPTSTLDSVLECVPATSTPQP